MTLYETIIGVLTEDLGPSAQSFLAKQCKLMNKVPDSLTANDIEELARLCYSGISQILGEEIAGKVRQNIMALKK